jgi:hypothetical protein
VEQIGSEDPSDRLNNQMSAPVAAGTAVVTRAADTEERKLSAETIRRLHTAVQPYRNKHRGNGLHPGPRTRRLRRPRRAGPAGHTGLFARP